MGELVYSITSLCKMLNNLTDISISLKPDFFRLAKLNKLSEEEMVIFQNLLHKLCCFTASCSISTNQCLVRCLAVQDKVVGYSLPPDASARQLLLCLGWILSQGVIEAKIDKMLLHSPLGEEFPNKTDRLNLPGSSVLPKPSDNCSQTQVNYTLYLIGQIQHNMKAIANYREERAHLTTKMHRLTAGFRGLPQLSAGDVALLMEPQSIPDYLARCQPVLQVLEGYSKWQRKSSVFWQWMDSILDEEESVDLNRHLSEKQFEHLNVFLKNLQENVRKIVRFCEDSVTEDLSTSSNHRVFLNEKSESLESVIESVDNRIRALADKNNKITQTLKKQFTNSDKFNEINIVLDKLIIRSQNNTKIPSPPLSPPNIGALSLGVITSDLTVNKIVLD